MQKILSIVVLSLLVSAGVSYAATTGKVQGTVRDAQTVKYCRVPMW